MGKIRVHEFTTMDGVIDEPRWTMEFGFDPKMGGAIATAMGGCDGILLGRVTYEMFEPGTLVRALLRDNLVDELHLFVYPLARPGGPTLFGAKAVASK